MHLFKPKYKDKNGKYITTKNWAVEFRENGKRHVKSLGTPNKTLANHRAKTIIAALEDQAWESVAPTLPSSKQSGVAIEDLIEIYKAFAEQKELRTETAQDNVRYLQKFAAETNAEYVHQLSVEKFLQTPYMKKLKSQSRASAMRKIMSIFSKDACEHYRSNGLFVQAPESRRSFWRAKPVEPFIAPERKSIIDLIQTADKELLPTSSSMWLLFTLAIQAGLRRNEAIYLRWVDVRADGVIIRSDETHQTKSGRTRFVPVSEAVLERIEMHRTTDDAYVISGDRRQAVRNLAPWLRKHGINDRKPIHYLRKLYGSLVATEHGLYTAKEYLGHSSVTITEDYYADLLHKKTVQWSA